MYGTSHETFRAGSVRTEDGHYIRRQRPSRNEQERRALAEQTGSRR
jgi:hypothetical protein